MSVSNLTNTKWVINKIPNLPSTYEEYDIIYSHPIPSHTRCVGLGINTTYILGSFSNDYTLYASDYGWYDEAYRIIEITGGTDVTNSALIQWLEANATQVQVTNLTNTIWKFASDPTVIDTLSLFTHYCNVFCYDPSQTSASGYLYSRNGTGRCFAINGYFEQGNTIKYFTGIGTYRNIQGSYSYFNDTFPVTNGTNYYGLFFALTSSVNNESNKTNRSGTYSSGTPLNYLYSVTPSNQDCYVYIKEYGADNTNPDLIAWLTQNADLYFLINVNASFMTSSGDDIIASVNGTAQITLTADSGFALPKNITVINADFTYNSTTGVISISNPIGNVIIYADAVRPIKFDLSTLDLSAGTHTIQVKARATGYRDSNFSNSVIYEVESEPYSITYNINNGTLIYEEELVPLPEFIGEDEEIYLIFKPNSNYYISETGISVTGAEYDFAVQDPIEPWGDVLCLHLYNAIDNVTININYANKTGTTRYTVTSSGEECNIEFSGIYIYTNEVKLVKVSHDIDSTLIESNIVGVTSEFLDTYEEAEDTLQYDYYLIKNPTQNVSIYFAYELPEISFTIDDIEYSARKEMTWRDWVDSEYNTDGYEVSDDYVIKEVDYFITDETPDDVIIENAEYTLTPFWALD